MYDENHIVANGVSHLCNRSVDLGFTEGVHVEIMHVEIMHIVDELHHMCSDE